MFFAWDQIPLSAVKTKGKYEIGYAKRLRSLLAQLEIFTGALEVRQDDLLVQLIPTRLVHSRAQAVEHYRELLRAGREGTILKAHDAIWKDGTSKDQVKLKLEVDVDLKIIGIAQGTPGTKNDGRPAAFQCESSCGQLRVDVTVKNEALRDQIEEDPGTFIDRIVAVRANAVMLPSPSNTLHSLFLPRMVEASYRIDKSDADSLESIQEQFLNAVA
jgi:DNA ligase-1